MKQSILSFTVFVFIVLCNHIIWEMETESRLDEYDFQKEYINAGDYVKIVEKGNLYDNYTVYFFDVETLTLYYIHTNI